MLYYFNFIKKLTKTKKTTKIGQGIALRPNNGGGTNENDQNYVDRITGGVYFFKRLLFQQ